MWEVGCCVVRVVVVGGGEWCEWLVGRVDGSTVCVDETTTCRIDRLDVEAEEDGCGDGREDKGRLVGSVDASTFRRGHR